MNPGAERIQDSTRGCETGVPAFVPSVLSSPIEIGGGPTPIEPFVPPRHSRTTWNCKLKALHQAREDRNIELSIATYHAHLDLPYGEWMKLWESEDRPFAITKAEKHDAIGKWAARLDSLDRGNLPKALNALDLLRKLDPALVHELIPKKDIHRKMTVNEAQTLVARYHPDVKPPSVGDNSKWWLSRLKRLGGAFPKGAASKDKQAAIA